MANEEKLTAIDELRLHIHDDKTFEAPDLEDLLAEIERLSAIEQERDALREALRPFATCIDRLAPGDDIAHWRLTDALNHGLTVAHVLTAAAALNQSRT